MHCSAQHHHIVIGRADILILLHGVMAVGELHANTTIMRDAEHLE